MAFFQRIKEGFANDHTIQRTSQLAGKAIRATPSYSAKYLVDKVPAVHWLPRYNPRWLLNDALAGITIGVMLIPQGLAYAKIATIPGEYGLMSSWLPNFLYFFMGTSKDMSTGPTSLMGLLTAEIIADVKKDGYSPQAIASAVAMSVGVYCLIVGCFKLGFLLEFVSIPVLNGFISAAGIVIMLGQIPSLFGVSVGTGTGTIIHDIFKQIPDFDGPTCGVGLGGILLLYLLQKMGQRWSKQSKIVWLIALARSAICLILFTAISYGVNKNKDDPIWVLSKVKSDGINNPIVPEGTLFGKVFARSVAPFIASAIEHLAIAKHMGRKNNYVIDPAQELVYLGVTNFFNSFFSSMPVGGAMSRTAINSDTGVKSPAYGIIAGGFIVLAIFKLSPALYWIPKATLAAIIVTAVMGIIVPPKVFWGYWKTSLVDFVAAMLCFWLTLFVNSETGIGVGVGFNIVYYLLLTAFARVKRVTKLDDCRQCSSEYENQNVPADTQVFKLSHSLLFANAMWIKRQCFDTVQTYNSGSVISIEKEKADRNWSVTGERRLTQLRTKAGIVDEPVPIRIVVLDFSNVHRIDTTGLVSLKDLKAELQRYGGDKVQLRFFRVRKLVRDEFERFGWVLVNDGDDAEEGEYVFETMADAVWKNRPADSREKEGQTVEVHVVGDEKV